MTHPTDETHRRATSPMDVTQPDATHPMDDAQPDATSPMDDAQPDATNPSPRTNASTSQSEPPALPLSAASPTPPTSSLRVDPDRPRTTEWREPPWFPPRDKERGPSRGALVAGIALVAIGLYFFIDRTLGIALPRIQWSTIWPVILIAIGLIILFRAVRRRS